jgi:hypothetical protein
MSHQIFTTPVLAKAEPVSRGSRLWRFYRGSNWGITVLQQQDGTFVQRTYVSQVEMDAAKKAYLGGHIYTVSAAEVSALTAAGYGAYITTVPDLP